MKFGELIRRLGRPLVKHENEIVVGPDGLSHIVIVTRAESTVIDGVDGWAYWFGCPCGALEGLDPQGMEVARALSCMRCAEVS